MSHVLYPHQQEALEWLLGGTRSRPASGALLTLPPRLGKTIVALEAVRKNGFQNVLVIAPLTLLHNWQNEILRAGLGPVKIAWKNISSENARWTITNYETVLSQEHRFQNSYDCIIIDESVRVKSREARISTTVRRLIRRNTRACTWLLSGNPVTRFLDDLWMQFQIISPRIVDRSYWRFVQEYCNTSLTVWGTKITSDRPGAAEQILHDFRDYMWTPNGLPDITPLETKLLTPVMHGSQLELYLEMQERFLIDLRRYGETDTILIAPNIMVMMSRLNALASNPLLLDGPDQSIKWDSVMELARRHVARPPVLIWSQYVRTAQELAVRFRSEGFRSAYIVGDVPAMERSRIVDEFQSGKLDILVMNPGVGKFGLNLSVANSVIRMERSWQFDDYYQSMFRVRHLQREQPVDVFEVLATLPDNRASIDHAIYRMSTVKTRRTHVLTAQEWLSAFEDSLDEEWKE